MPWTFFILFKTNGGLFQKPLYCPQFFVNLHLKGHGFMYVLFPKILTVKGQGHDIQFKYLDKNEQFLQQISYLSWFLNFQNAPLMRCNHCHFPCGLGENIVENLNLLEIYLLNFFVVLVVPYWSIIIASMYFSLLLKDHSRTADKQ